MRKARGSTAMPQMTRPKGKPVDIVMADGTKAKLYRTNETAEQWAGIVARLKRDGAMPSLMGVTN